MVGFKKPTKDIRHVIFNLLAQKNALNTYFTASQLATLCNHACGLEDGDDGINKDAIVLALSYGESFYNTSFVDAAGLDAEVVEGDLYCCVSHRFNSATRFTAAGRFLSADLEKKARSRLIEGEEPRINLRNWSTDLISTDAKEAFVNYVESNKETAIRKQQNKKQNKR
jgi:hypothetical protein